MNKVTRKSALPSIFDDSFDSFFQGFFRPMGRPLFSGGEHVMPAVDLEEKDDRYLLSADLPGFDKDDIELSFANGRLTIKAEHKMDNENKDKSGHILNERRFGSYVRTIDFGNNVAEEDISADYDKGVLHMALPKRQKTEEPTVRKIKVG